MTDRQSVEISFEAASDRQFLEMSAELVCLTSYKREGLLDGQTDLTSTDRPDTVFRQTSKSTIVACFSDSCCIVACINHRQSSNRNTHEIPTKTAMTMTSAAW